MRDLKIRLPRQGTETMVRNGWMLSRETVKPTHVLVDIGIRRGGRVEWNGTYLSADQARRVARALAQAASEIE